MGTDGHLASLVSKIDFIIVDTFATPAMVSVDLIDEVCGPVTGAVDHTIKLTNFDSAWVCAVV